jgi:hypothetical protein
MFLQRGAIREKERDAGIGLPDFSIEGAKEIGHEKR